MTLQIAINQMSIHEKDKICQQYLQHLYATAFIKRSVTPSTVNETYGEILSPSIAELIQAMHLSADDVFVDYGSGIGKLVMQVFLQSTVKTLYGIEIVPALHEQAVAVAKHTEMELPEFYGNNRAVHFLLGSFLEIPVHEATVAMVVSTCFTQDLLDALGELINDTASIHTVFSLRPINTLRRVPFIKTIAIECTWDSALCYVYSAR